MFQGWRHKLKEAEAALDANRLEEAAELLCHGSLREVHPAQKLALRIARRLIESASIWAGRDNRKNQWRQLDFAKAIAGEIPEYLIARDELISKIFSETEVCLERCDATSALARTYELERHNVDGRSLEHFKQVAEKLIAAERLVRFGKFDEANVQYEIASNLMKPNHATIEASRVATTELASRFVALRERLEVSMSNENWPEASAVAEKMLEIAPDDREIRTIFRTAVVKAQRGQEAPKTTVMLSSRERQEGTRENTEMSLHDKRTAGRRFLMWVDAVGGFLVCLENDVVLGQASPGNSVAVPILGDLSRRHAIISRQGGAYIVEPIQPVNVEGRPISGKTLLTDGDELEMGNGVRICFRQPHALSSSARLEVVSRHRTQPAADAILLMSESLVMGPGWRNHVVCRDWEKDFVIYRERDALMCRSASELEIDGQWVAGRGQLTANSRIIGSDFSMSLEDIGA